jgi:molybdopterin-containing oxidoreductase family iron-sulfur binding subunit
MTDGMNRRRFLKVLGAAGGGAAAVSACGIGPEPQEKLIPYLVPPEDQIPGVATYYATTCRECPAGCGVHARVREGRVVKLEGNPESPINNGRLCARGQAALQGLYNPDRLRTPLVRNAEGRLEPTTWDEALARLATRLRRAQEDGGGIVLVTGPEVSSFGDLVTEWMQAVGGRRVAYEPFGYEALREGNRLAFGSPAVPLYDFAAAGYVISFGADFLDTWLSPVSFQQGFAAARVPGGRAAPAKLVFVGPRLSTTGINADEWIAAIPGSEGTLALAMAQVIVSRRLAPVPADAARLGDALERFAPARVAAHVGLAAAVIERLAAEFAASGAGLAVAGGMAAHYPNGAAIVTAVNLLNYVAGSVGTTVRFGADLAQDGAYRDMAALQRDMATGRVALLMVHGANPGHSLSGGFWQAWGKVGFKVSFSCYLDETAAAADLVLPDHHPLEQWSDSRPRAGVYALQQPVMQSVIPDARPAGDVVLTLMARTGTFKDHLRERWRALHARYGRGRSFEQFWSDALQHGGLYERAAARPTRLAPDAARWLAAEPEAPTRAPAVGHTAVVFPHPALYDGRGANKPWLQELPDPVSKITWHAWVEVHPETAAALAVTSGDVVQLESPHGAVEGPVWVTPTVSPGVLAVPTGQGHREYGRYARERSFSAFDLLPAEASAYGGRDFTVPVRVRKTREHRRLATTEGSPRARGLESAHLLPVAQAGALGPGDHPFAHEEFPKYAGDAMEGWAGAQRAKAELGNYAGAQPRWGMAIDLSRCTGCSACVTACYAENNIATVGEDLVLRGREMSWLRIERYFAPGEHDRPGPGVSLPMLCQHCGNAPCEPVCPVYAAYHTPDGLNGQVYNRCVGTRYCANNCPYKVRYFNWYNYAEPGGAWEAWPEPLHLLLNPDVTVREKGVMEKCTFCVQRIRGAQNRARLEDRPVRDGEIVPACAQSCPSEAIVFGDLNDPESRVRRLAEHPRGYHVLEGLNTLPAVTYLARVAHYEPAGAAAHGTEH